MSEILRIEIPTHLAAERRYVIAVLFDDFLGIETQVVENPRAAETTITCGDGGLLILTEGFFATKRAEWLTPGSIPTRTDVVPVRDQVPLDPWHPGSVVTLGRPPSVRPGLVELDDAGGRVSLDVLGTAFFMLTRYEEVARQRTDSHGRFPFTSAVTAGHVLRPIVDEQVEVLWACLRHVWPALSRRSRSFAAFATHDVDHAFAYVSCTVTGLARLAGRQLLRDKSAIGATRTARDWLTVRQGDVRADPFNTYDEIMSACEEAGAECAFYFIPDPQRGGRDPRHIYRPEDRPVGDILRRIVSRGHEIGVHPSYGSHLNPGQLRAELARLQSALNTLGISQQVRGGRQHYLRWSAADSWRLWAEAGLLYDSTVGFAEHIGFRAGVCRSYATFDLVHRRPLTLRERPLLVMDRTLGQYMGLDLGGGEALHLVTELKRTTRSYAGEFVTLWHNSTLVEPHQRELYRAVLAA
ncbi:MAG: polysaccharide deacetylase family protein [Actinomycetota bacterium]|nr:polysaccharide deacetylase family protein [Actinomycetota bacterium]